MNLIIYIISIPLAYILMKYFIKKQDHVTTRNHYYGDFQKDIPIYWTNQAMILTISIALLPIFNTIVVVVMGLIWVFSIPKLINWFKSRSKL